MPHFVTAQINEVSFIRTVDYRLFYLISGGDETEGESSFVMKNPAIKVRAWVCFLKPERVGRRVAVVVGEVPRGKTGEGYERTIQHRVSVPFFRAARECVPVNLFPCVIYLNVDGSERLPVRPHVARREKGRSVAGGPRLYINNCLCKRPS